jgi:hypothetical protein
MAGIKDTARTQHSAVSRNRRTNADRKTLTPKRSKTPQTKARRARRSDSSGRVTTFPEVKGKVVREVQFSHYDPENVLAIAFKDRTVLVFEVDPTPLVLPVDIRAHYIGERHSAPKTWERLAADKKSD